MRQKIKKRNVVPVTSDQLCLYNAFFRQQYQINICMKSLGFDKLGQSRNKGKFITGSASMKCLPLTHQNVQNTSSKQKITVPSAKVQQEAKIYQWRSKTEFPIVKVTSYLMKGSNNSNAIFEVEVENFSARLADLKNISLFKMLYLLKEAIIGYERLFHNYGPFIVSAKMIMMNMANKCKVWLSDNFASNTQRSCLLDERSFLTTLFRIFEQRANNLKNTRLFFQQLNQCKTFCSALAFLQEYAKINKISILSSCKFSPNEICKQVEPKVFQGTLTMNELPKSLEVIPLRNSLDYKSKSCLKEVLPSFGTKQNMEQHEQVSIKLKKSDDTAAELFQKKSSGLQPEDQFFIESTLYKTQESSEPLARSQLQPKLKSNLNFIRKFSDQYACLTPSRSKASFASPTKLCPNLPRSKWNQNSFINCEYEQPNNFNNVFNQNKWEKTLNGLFSDTTGDQLKKSFHEGKEQRRTNQKFQYLDKFGKAIKESFIHEEDLNQN